MYVLNESLHLLPTQRPVQMNPVWEVEHVKSLLLLASSVDVHQAEREIVVNRVSMALL